MKLQKRLSPDQFIMMNLYLLYLLALVVTSSFTSPLYPQLYGDDSALFSLLGKGILHGKILYLDLFDHKGPMIFFINALGYWIAGHNGILLVQYLFGCISLTFLYFTAKMLSPVLKKPLEYILLFSCVFAVFFYTFEQGNLTEEYSQPFLSSAIYLFVKYAVRCKEHPKHPPIFAFFYGVALAFLSFLRLNNATTICAGILAIFVYLLYKKEYINLICNILAGFLGLSVISIPIFAYFSHHSALHDMIYATFLYNFQIVGNTGNQYFFDHVIKFSVLLFPIAICFLLFCSHVFKSRKLVFLDCLLGCILLCNVIVFYIANRYPHYFAVFVPVYAAYLFRYFKPVKKSIFIYLLITCTAVNLISLGYTTAKSAYGTYIINSPKDQYASVQEAVSIIPDTERDSIIGYQVPVSYYHLGDILPCYKYYTWQESWATIDPQILIDFMDWVQSEKPLWILTSPQEDHPVLMELLSEQYEIKSESKLLVCYRLKSPS